MTRHEALTWMQDHSLYLVPGRGWTEVMHFLQEYRKAPDLAEKVVKAGLMVPRDGGPTKYPMLHDPKR